MAKTGKNKGKIAISTKIFLALFAMAGLISVALISAMVEIVYRAGNEAGQSGGQAMRAQAKEALLSATRLQARKSENFLARIEHDARITAEYLSRLYENKQEFLALDYYDPHLWVSEGGAGQYFNVERASSSIFAPNTAELDMEVIEDMELSAHMDLVISHIQEHKEIVAAYFGTERDVIRYYPDISLGTVVDPDFRVTKRPWYLSAAPAANPEKSVVWSDIYEDATGKGLLVTAAAPVYSGDEFAGVVGLDITLQDLAKEVVSADFMGSGRFFVFDDQGRIIIADEEVKKIAGRRDGAAIDQEQNEEPMYMHDPDLKAFSESKSGVNIYNIGKKEYYLAHFRIGGTGWTIAGLIAKDEALEIIDVFQSRTRSVLNGLIIRWLLPGTLALLVLIFAASTVLTRLLLRPLKDLARLSQRLAAGEWGTKAAPPKTDDEIGRLTESLNDMSETLRRYDSQRKTTEERLSQKVSERTKELESKIEELENFQRLTTDRELKMIELKKELQEIRKKQPGKGGNE